MKKGITDHRLIIYFAILIVFGLIVLTSASVSVGLVRFNDPYFFIKRQIYFGILPGLLLFFLFSKIDYHFWRKNAYWIFLLTCLLLVLVFIPGIGSNYGTSAKSWLNIFGYSFQPSEVIKLVLIIFLASLLSNLGIRIQNFKEGFLVALVLGIIPVGLVALQPDLGTVSILFSIIIFILFLAEAKFSHLISFCLIGLIIFGLLIAISPKKADRFKTFLHPELDSQGVGYHINQAYLAIGSGGLFGLGLGHSRQKFAYLPEVHADSIFAIIAEETGFFLTVGFVLFLIIFVARGFKIAKYAPDNFARLTVSGIMSWIMVQSFLNISAMLGLMPLTGVPLPFVSHGGTALMILMAGMGIVVNISKFSKE